MTTKSHIRRCHVCGQITESQSSLVHHCEHCGKYLAPFYYFDEKLAMGLKSKEESDQEYKSSALPFKEYPPVRGISVYWDL